MEAVRRALKTIEKLFQESQDLSNAKATHIIKIEFCKAMGKIDPKLVICVGDSKISNALVKIPNPIEPEWLYDFCALAWDDDYSHLQSVYLVLESEWGNFDEIRDDFLKVVQSDSLRKVMIFQGPDKAALVDIAESLQEDIVHYKASRGGNMQYILAGWDNEVECFLFFEYQT